ncbi:ferrous iron transport protein A [Azospirillum sp. CT11-132]|uniref:FeoA family protein n=1 Tax=Azospirillum sp. CT11-132 TaxID=3396317 RepID=UPI0039A43687
MLRPDSPHQTERQCRDGGLPARGIIQGIVSTMQRSVLLRRPLGGLRRGVRAEVAGLDEGAVATTLPAGELERRLIEMGLVEGAVIEILYEGFPARDPIAIRVNDHTIALRRNEANAVLVYIHGDQR